MKKSMKSKKPLTDPAGHPPVLDLQPDVPKPSTQMPERHRHAGRKGQKGSR